MNVSSSVLINKKNILSKINGVMNAVKTCGDKFGQSLLYGHGAGGDATASAVVSNICDYCAHLNGVFYKNLCLKLMQMKSLTLMM